MEPDVGGGEQVAHSVLANRGQQRDPVELAREFASWVEATPDERRGRGRQALRYGLDNFGLERNVALLQAVLDDVLVEHRERRATQS